MRSRRFLLLSGVLVALNTALWLTPQGLALRQVALPQLFGKSLMRADVVLSNRQEWRVDRGVITQVNSSQLTLREADTRVQQIGLTSATHVTSPAGPLAVSSLQRGWRVLVTWPANGSADLVKVERRGGGGGRGGGGTHGHSKP